MPDRADAHIHLFDGGYQGGSLASRPGVMIDEVALYAALAMEHRVARALVVGYEGEAWARGNNAHLAKLAAKHEWVAPVAFVDLLKAPDLSALERLRGQGFVGLSLYVFDGSQESGLGEAPAAIWEWLVRNRWLVSVNSRGKHWSAWLPILEKHPDLRLIASHLGLPGRFAQPPARDVAREAMSGVLALATFPGTRVKLSGFYAISDPPHGYPHPAAWPCVALLKEAFGAKRLLWGSDFSPCLGHVTFPQTVDVLDHVPCLNADDRACIQGGNLLGLISEAGS
ncbi:MAG TPA: amidohydrolase family protein [Verrucomicrobiae bacterium]|nr:amidohydrolase family protein [Verrucomicrobiae bacterium]